MNFTNTPSPKALETAILAPYPPSAPRLLFSFHLKTHVRCSYRYSSGAPLMMTRRSGFFATKRQDRWEKLQSYGPLRFCRVRKRSVRNGSVLSFLDWWWWRWRRKKAFYEFKSKSSSLPSEKDTFFHQCWTV